MPQQQVSIVKPDANGGFKLPIRQGEVARIDVVDVDLVIQAKDGTRYVLAGAGLEAMTITPPPVAFSDGAASSATLLESVGVVQTPDVSIPVMSSLTEHDAKTSEGDKSFHGDGINDVTATTADTAARADARAEAQGQSDQGGPLAEASDSTVEQIVEKVASDVNKLHDKAADPVPVEPFEAPTAPAAGVGAAPNPVSLTPLLVLDMGNVVDATSGGGTYQGSGGVSGSEANDSIDVRDSKQIEKETVTGSAGDDVIYADGTSVGTGSGNIGVSYNADGTVNGTAHFAKEFTVQISGYFTTLTKVTITISGNTTPISIEGGTDLGGGTWELPLTVLTENGTFKIIYQTFEADSANPVHDSFTLTLDITGVTRAETFTSSSTYYMWISDADTLNDISRSYSGEVVYVLPAQGVPNSIDAGAGNDVVHAGYGNDIISLGSGDNTVYAGYGVDTITAGTGNDVIYAQLGSGGDTISVGDGANIVTSGTGADTITTGSGNDTITAGDGANVIVAGDGANTITAGSGADNITSGSGADSITAGDGANTIVAGDGTNIITAGSGADSITSGSGDDTITAGDGANVIVAGDGTNTITAGSGADNITSGSGDDTITAGDGNNVVVSGGGADTVTTGSGNDSITAGAGADSIVAGAGVDIIYGQDDGDTIYADAGNDTVYGGLGANEMHGGADTDTLSFADLAVGATASLTAGTATVSGVGSTFDGFENLEGSAQADTLTGDASVNTITGSGGDDALNGAGGADAVLGGAGSDTINVTVASAGATLDGGADDDTVNISQSVASGTVTGGSGTDELSVTDSTADHRLDLGTGGSVGGYIDGATITGFEVVRFIGTTVDTLTGTSGNETVFLGVGADSVDGGEGDDVLWGGNGGAALTAGDAADTMVGGAGNDTLYGDDGGDNLSGGAGDDIIVASTVSSGSFADLPNLVVTNDSDTNYLYGNAGNDIILGSGAVDSIYGGTGADTIYGGAGNDIIYTDTSTSSSSSDGIDTVFGGTGNDTMYGSYGADVICGGTSTTVDSGTDTVSYYYSASGVTVTLNASGNSSVTSGGEAEGDQLYGIEYLVGSNYGGDVLTVTNASTHYLWGYAGADTLIGGTGVDVLYGGNDNDTLTGGTGNDYLLGENGDDTLYGGDGNEVSIDGGAGNDLLYGEGGNDYMQGQAGNDTMYGGDGNDTMDGNTGNDIVYGEAGNDTLRYSASSSAGNDTIDGGTGTDTLDCSASSNSVTVFLVDTTDGLATGDRPSNVPSTFTAGDGFIYSSSGSLYSVIKADAADGDSSIENITGSASNDILVGDASANSIVGGAGGDHIYGKGGADTLDGGADDDSIYVTATELAVAGLTVNGNTGTADRLTISGLSAAALNDAAIAKISNVEVLDVRDGSIAEAYALTSTQATNIVDNGTSSLLTFILDTGDTFTADVSGTDYVKAVVAGVTTTYGAGEDRTSAGVDVTFLYYNSGGTLQATVNVDY